MADPAGRPRPLLLPLAAVFLLALAPVGAEEESPSIEERIREVEAAEGLAGLETLWRAVEEPEARRAVRRVLAARHREAGDPHAALAHYEAVIEADDRPADRVGYAEALVAVARQNLAGSTVRAFEVVPYLADARNALAPLDARSLETPLRARAIVARAESWFYAGELERTLEALGDMAALPADARPVAQGLRAQALYRLGKHAEAAAAFEAAGQPHGAAAAWAAAKDGARAAAAYGALLRETPTDLGLLAQAVRAARYAGGAEALRETLRGIPPEALGDGATRRIVRAAHLVARFDLAALTGAADAAVPLLKEAVQLDPERSTALVRLARHALTATDLGADTRRARATELLLQALARTPEDPQVVGALWHVAGRDYLQLWRSAGQGPSAARTLRIQRALVEHAPDDATAWANLGNTLRITGRTEEALAAYARALEANPWDPAILSDRGLALAAAGRPDDALAAYLASIELDEGHLSGRQNAARALWLRGRDAEAAAHLAAALRKARVVDRNPMTYRFLLDRVWRSRQDEDLR